MKQKMETSDIIDIKEDIIDNPGKGNCAYYAFVIGLIYIIQEENEYHNTSTFDRWVSYDSSIKEYFDSIVKHDFDKPAETLLNRLQRSVRLVNFHYRIAELKKACASSANNYAQLLAKSDYISFLYLFYANPEDIDPQFNIFANVPAIQNALDNIDRSRVDSVHLTLAPIFLKLMYGHNDANYITPQTPAIWDSAIIESLTNITEDFFWGTHLDMDYLARVFAVNLHIYADEQPIHSFVNIPGRPTVTLKNIGNYHWVTKLLRIREISGYQAPAEPDKPYISQKNNLQLIDKSGSGKETIHIEKEETESDDDKLKRLQKIVLQVTNEYTSYTKKHCFLSIFHRHGNTGRVRANKFRDEFAQITNYQDGKSVLLDYMYNNKNGNTHPHSHRTMLLQQLVSNSVPVTLQEVSNNFNNFLSKLMNCWNYIQSHILR